MRVCACVCVCVRVCACACVCVCVCALKTYQQGDDQPSVQLVHWTSSLYSAPPPLSTVKVELKDLLFIVSDLCLSTRVLSATASTDKGYGTKVTL